MHTNHPMIHIIPENRDAIEEALAFVNGYAKAYTYHSYKQIEPLAEEAERKALELMGQPLYLPGAEYHAVSGGLGKTEKARKATRVVLIRCRFGWYLMRTSRTTIHRDPPPPQLTLPQPIFAGQVF